MSKAVDQSHLAIDPFIVVRAGARSAGMEKLLFAAPDVDGDGEFVLDGIFHQPVADLPGGLFVEEAELQLLLFQKQSFENFIHRVSLSYHKTSSW